MNLYRRIVNKIVRSSIKSNPDIKQDFFWHLTEHIKSNMEDLNFVLNRLGNELAAEIDKYPSAFNDGYLHIHKAIEYVRHYNLHQEPAIIVDVGAALGVTAEKFSKAFPASDVYAFEPIQSTFQSLKKNVSGNKNIRPINKGLGKEAGQFTIHLSKRITSSSLLDMKKNISNEFFSDNIQQVGTEMITVSTLDKEIPSDKNISILKMDVQGYELEILKGGTESLKHTSVILVEMQNHDLYSNAPMYYDIDLFLRQHGFELRDMIPSIRQDRKLYEWDAIYVNKNILK